MPWKTVTPMEEVTRFVLLARSDRFTITELCEHYSAFAEGKSLIGISRRTCYSHLARSAAGGMKGLPPRSHRPHRFPQRSAAVAETLLKPELLKCDLGRELLKLEDLQEAWLRAQKETKPAAPNPSEDARGREHHLRELVR